MGAINFCGRQENVTIDYFEHLKNLLEVNNTLNSATHNYYASSAGSGLKYCPVPFIVGITGACDNIDTLFRILNKMRAPAFFTQTGQLGLEFAQLFSPGVYTIIHSGRDEGEEDARHLLEFNLTEEEFGWPLVCGSEPYDEDKIYEQLLKRIEAAVKFLSRQILREHSETLSRVYNQDVLGLLRSLKYPFLRITYDEVIKLLQNQGYQLQWGDDLKAEHEAQVVSLVNNLERQENPILKNLAERPVLVMKYPKHIKFFNMKRWGKDSRLALSADLLLPLAGEAVGAAVREHNPTLLKEELLGSNMFKSHQNRGGTYDDFVWYVEKIIGSGKVAPHAGYGLGNERLLQYLFGCRDIRQVSVYSLMAQFTGDFAEKNRGKAFIYGPPPRAILLSLADEAKKLLCPAIKKLLAQNNCIVYATAGTKKFLDKEGAPGAVLVHKVSLPNGQPNLAHLIKERGIGTIINIPQRKGDSTAITDGQKIRELAIDSGTYLVTDAEVAQHLLVKLANSEPAKK